jgi:hypothetical protein
MPAYDTLPDKIGEIFIEPLKHVIEGKLEGRIEVTVRQGRRCKQLLDYFKEKEDRYCNFKEEASDRNVWRTPFGRGYGPS